jgi:ribosomal protein S18 acetylase RimI-like enzyme
MAATGLLTRRPVRADDDGFLRRLHESTRQAEVADFGWGDAQRMAFFKMQFDAQRHYYHTTFPRATFDIVEEGKRPIGRLYLDRGVHDIRLIDIALLPTAQNRGLGSHLLHGVLEEAEAAGKRVGLHVAGTNPAIRLYQRLGFVQTGDDGVYRSMEWRSDRSGPRHGSEDIGAIPPNIAPISAGCDAFRQSGE